MQAQMRQEVSAAPCRMLFGDTEATDEQIQVAVFSDYNCPYCRVLSRMVKRLMDEGVPIRVTWHDLPVLGPRSEAAARAALAAAEQGAYLQVHQRLMQTILRPGTVHLVKLAGEFGLDEDRFVRDATGPKTERSIERAKAIAAVFGIAGTPALMVGRTLVVGEIDEASLQKLVQLELEHPDDPCLKG
jgi:protein-disulfide isomerase